MTANIVQQFITYNQLALDEGAIAADSMSEVQRFLRLNPNAWRVPRPTPPVDPISNTRFHFFVGEEGCGKTTQLRFELERSKDPESTVVISIDFTRATELAVADLGNIDPPLGTHFLNCVENAVDRNGIRDEYSFSLRRSILETQRHSSLSPVQSTFRREGRAISSVEPFELLDSRAITDAISVYQSQQTKLGNGIDALRAVQYVPGRQCIIAIDNVDHLDDAKIRKIFSLLAGAIEGNTVVYLALRSENVGHTSLLGLHGQRHPQHFACDGHSLYIIEGRLQAAEQYAKHHRSKFPTSSDSQFIAAAHAVLGELRDDTTSRRLFEDWRNGDLREILPDFVNIVDHILDRHAGVFERRDLRSALIEKILRDSPPAALDFFNPSNVMTIKNKGFDFVFLRLRILAYLRRTGGEVNVSDLLLDFDEHFGISENTIRKTLRKLTKVGCGVPFIRLANGAGPGDKPQQIMLLPAGLLFKEILVTRAAYLEWVFDRTSNGPVISRLPKDGRKRTTRKAVAALEDIVLPLFIREHPYMVTTEPIKNVYRKRVKAYSDLFDYGKDGWFIDSLVASLKEYQGGGDVHTRRIEKAVGKMSARLTDILHDA